MTVTIEISHYPLKKNYEEDIISFIEEIRKEPLLTIRTTAMCTYVKGELDVAFSAIQRALVYVYRTDHLSSTVIKVIPKDLPIEDGYLEF